MNIQQSTLQSNFQSTSPQPPGLQVPRLLACSSNRHRTLVRIGQPAGLISWFSTLASQVSRPASLQPQQAPNTSLYRAASGPHNYVSILASEACRPQASKNPVSERSAAEASACKSAALVHAQASRRVGCLGLVQPSLYTFMYIYMYIFCVDTDFSQLL